MRALVASITVALAGLAPAAFADPVEDAAQLHLDRGIAAFERGDFVGAHRELLACHDLVPDRANPYRWLALTEIQLGDCAAALGNIAEFLSRVPATDRRVPEMSRWRELCRRTGILHVDSIPRPVTLRIDGSVVGTTPFRSLSIRAGSHALAGEQPGYRGATRTIVVPPGGEVRVTLELEPASRPLTGRWWFWPAVGAVALSVAGAVAYASTRDDPASLLPPITCDPAGCRP